MAVLTCVRLDFVIKKENYEFVASLNEERTVTSVARLGSLVLFLTFPSERLTGKISP